MNDRFVVIIRPVEQSFKFGELAPQGRVKMSKQDAVKLASRIRRDDDRDVAVQIVDIETGKVLNVNRIGGNPNLISISHDASNGC